MFELFSIVTFTSRPIHIVNKIVVFLGTLYCFRKREKSVVERCRSFLHLFKLFSFFSSCFSLLHSPLIFARFSSFVLIPHQVDLISFPHPLREFFWRKKLCINFTPAHSPTSAVLFCPSSVFSQDIS